MIRVSALAEDQLDAARRCFPARWARVVEEKLFGPCPPPVRSHPIGAWDDDRLVGVAVQAGRWLRVLAVAPEDSGSGAGSALLEEASRLARAAGETRLRTGDQPGNYLTPGLDVADEITYNWLVRRGFRNVAWNENLVVSLDALPDRPTPAGYELRRATPEEAFRLTGWIAAQFGVPWAFEAKRSIEGDPPGVHVAFEGDNLVAFACHDGNNRGLGWFGPAGTSEEHRGKGLGQALLVACLRDVREAGHKEGVIAWAGPRLFYEKTIGARSGTRFVVLEKPL